MQELLVPVYGNEGMEFQIWGVAYVTYGAIGFIFDSSYLRRVRATPLDVIPVSDINLAVNGNPHMIWNIVFANVQNILQLTSRASQPQGRIGIQPYRRQR